MVRTPATVPGSLSEGAGSPIGLTEGVSFDGCFGPMVCSQFLALKFLSGYVHRGTLPQLRCAQQLPQRGSREGCVPFNVPHPKTATFRAIFIAPTKLKSFYIPPFIGSRAAIHSRSISTVVTYISLQLAGMSSGVISRRGSPMYFFLCSTPW